MPYHSDMPDCMNITDCLGVFAKSMFPSSGKCGKFIVIPNCNDVLTLEQRTKMITHEIGHTLGFRHAQINCGNNTAEAINDNDCSLVNGLNHLWGTPQCDQWSVMWSGENTNQINAYDQISASMLYPAYGYPPEVDFIVPATSNNPAYKAWTFYMNNYLPWYEFNLVLYKVNSNNTVTWLKQTGWYLGSQPKGISYTGLGNYRVSIMGRNYRGDFGLTTDYYTSIP